jgi:hypothetical protein
MVDIEGDDSENCLPPANQRGRMAKYPQGDTAVKKPVVIAVAISAVALLGLCCVGGGLAVWLLTPSAAERVVKRHVQSSADDPESVSLSDVEEYAATHRGRAATGIYAKVRQRNRLGGFVMTEEVYLIQNGTVVASRDANPSLDAKTNIFRLSN